MASNERNNLHRELESDQQAAVLYSPFREKSLNPQSWTRKIKFWENLLAETALAKRNLTFDVNMLPLMFERKGMIPKCLGTVVQEMKKSGRIRSVEDYTRKNGWLSWGLSTLVRQPLQWGVGQLFGSPHKDSGVYVWPEVVKILCQEVLEIRHSSVQNELSDSLISMAKFRTQCQSLVTSDQNFDIIISQLERDNKIAVTETWNKEIVIKFCKMGESAVSPVRDIDLQIYRIVSTMHKLETDIPVLSSRAKGQVDVARTHLRDGRISMAKHCLRQKKILLRMMDKMSGSLTNLHDILQAIEEASTNEMVIKACEAATAAMKNINQEISAEGVETIMDNVREALDNQEEINQAMSSPIAQDDSQQLEWDLEQLLAEGQVNAKSTEENSLLEEGLSDGLMDSKPAADSRLQDLHPATVVDDLGLPSVPTHSPSHPDHTQRSRTDHNQRTDHTVQFLDNMSNLAI